MSKSSAPLGASNNLTMTAPIPDHIYSAVAARRLQWDNLVWQVPVLSLTAQAFLYTVELGGDTTRTARVIAAVLSITTVFLCTTLMARHRQAELFDAHWLERVESSVLGHGNEVHGYAFALKRNGEPVDGGWTDYVIPIQKGYKTWIGGLLVFGFGSFVVIVMTLLFPTVLER